MVIFEWQRKAMDQKSRNGLPMIGEDTGLEALASPQAGYLGKIRERATSLEHCPWCTLKGLTCVLRSYRINLHESISLCTNPKCLFPLVSQSLDDVLARLVPVEPTEGNKRKNASALEKEESIEPKCKRLRSSELDSFGPQHITASLVTLAEQSPINITSNGQHAAPKTDVEKVNGYHMDSPVAETTGCDLQKHEDDVLDRETATAVCTEVFAPLARLVSPGHLQCSSDTLSTANCEETVVSPDPGALGLSEAKDDFRQMRFPPNALDTHCSQDSNQPLFTESNFSMDIDFPQHNEHTIRIGYKSLAADSTTCKCVQGIESESMSPTTIDTEELVPTPNQIFWRNSDNLCWLDSMLVALVQCRSLRKCKPKDKTGHSPVGQLMRGYDDVCEAIQIQQQPGTDGVMKVPNHVLEKARADLQSLRMSVFKLLQPKLQCELGQKETPVFALPLLLTMDSWVEPLFKSIFHWELKCSECNTLSRERVTKTLPTFTNTVPDWHPLHAVHFGPCNVCCKKNQRRTMILERVPPVFGLHFVEGLPNNDVRNYAFTFEGKSYIVTTLIQYNMQLKHFVTWVHNSDGSWLEYDDLNHPECKTHQKLPVPAEEIHIVFWEVKENKGTQACSPYSTFAESQQPEREMKLSPGDKDLTANESLANSADYSLLLPPDDTDIICALSTSEDGSNIMDTTVTADVDTSIGSTTLLDTFEGLTHNDIITLTLVEIQPDSDTQPVIDNVSIPHENEIVKSTPDSSTIVIGGDISDNLHGELPSTSNSSENEDLFSYPTFVPGATGGQGRNKGKPNIKKMDKTAATVKDALHVSSPESTEPSKAIVDIPASAATAQESTPPAETTRPVLPVSPTCTYQMATSQESLTELPMPLQNKRWSFLLDQHPLNKGRKSVDKPAPIQVPQIKPAHSTPNTVRIPGGFLPKPQLKTEESEGFPLKAAEMYDSFGTKSSSTPRLLLPSSATSLPTSGSTGPPLSSHSSKVKGPSRPPGLSDTEALRYKLLKKLKAKKKKLAKLNEMLGHHGGVKLRPDSTKLSSPNTVTSSTYEGSIGDDLLSDLLSPATTASNLSPDSSSFLEVHAGGHEAGGHVNGGLGAASAVSQAKPCMNEPNIENFLDEFLSQADKRTEMETEALSMLEMFVV